MIAETTIFIFIWYSIVMRLAPLRGAHLVVRVAASGEREPTGLQRTLASIRWLSAVHLQTGPRVPRKPEAQRTAGVQRCAALVTRPSRGLADYAPHLRSTTRDCREKRAFVLVNFGTCSVFP